MSKLKSFSHVFLSLLQRDLLTYKREFWGKLFDMSFLLFTNAIVFGYFMSGSVTTPGYGTFILIGAITVFGFFDTVGKISMLIADIEGDRTISYTLTMPIPSWLVFIYTGFYWSLNSALVSIFLFPIGKLFLFEQFDLSKISYFRLLCMFLSINLFFGFFSLWLCGIIKKMSNLAFIFVRVINPLFMFGGYFYSWKTLYGYSPVLASISLINPLVYAMEGMRSASLGADGYLPFWINVLALWAFIIACAWHGTKCLQKKLDCV